jgi:hypothetical protein
MTEYKFLLKPLFFIFNLIFATWLVLKIEQIQPSDFGRYRSIFESKDQLNPEKLRQKKYLEKIFSEYKHGLLDSVQVAGKLEKYLLAPTIASVKQTADNEKK